MQCGCSNEITLSPRKKKDDARILIILVVAEGSYLAEYLFHDINNFLWVSSGRIKKSTVKEQGRYSYFDFVFPAVTPTKGKMLAANLSLLCLPSKSACVAASDCLVFDNSHLSQSSS